MNKYLIACFLIFVAVAANAQKINCKKFRSGKFKIITQEYGVFIIERNSNTQTEYILGKERDKQTYKIKWVNDCTYTLNSINPQKDIEMGIPANAVLTIQITSVTDSSYVQTTSSNFSDQKLTSELIKIK